MEICNGQKTIELKNLSAINSGMLFNTEFFLKKGGYNTNLRIDFCDHDFIERLNGQNIFADILPIDLKQDFSASTNDKGKSLHRYKIYLKDMKEYRKGKNFLLFFLRVDLPHLLKEIYRNRSFEFLKIRLQ